LLCVKCSHSKHFPTLCGEQKVHFLKVCLLLIWRALVKNTLWAKVAVLCTFLALTCERTLRQPKCCIMRVFPQAFIELSAMNHQPSFNRHTYSLSGSHTHTKLTCSWTASTFPFPVSHLNPDSLLIVPKCPKTITEYRSEHFLRAGLCIETIWRCLDRLSVPSTELLFGKQ